VVEQPTRVEIEEVEFHYPDTVNIKIENNKQIKGTHLIKQYVTNYGWVALPIEIEIAFFEGEIAVNTGATSAPRIGADMQGAP